MIKVMARLYIIHLFAIPAIAFGMYLPGLDLLLALVYLIFIWQEGLYADRILNPLQLGVTGVVWQFPGIFLALIVILGWDLSLDLSYYSIFILEIWQTPLLPLISLMPTWIINNYPSYYYLLLLAVPLVIVVYIAPAIKGAVINRNLRKMNPLA